MIEVISYSFFQHALLSILLVGVACAVIGTYVVTRRLLFIAGGITHASFGGLGLSAYLGINPTLGAFVFAIGSAFGIDMLARRKTMREDSAIAAFWAMGMALGVMFLFLTPGYSSSLTEFLFGSILTITRADLVGLGCFTVLLLLFFMLYYRTILYVAFDRDFAITRHYPVRMIESVMICFVAICVVLTIRLIGIMLMISMLSLPQNCAALFTQRFKTMIILSAIISIICGVIGLFTAYWLNVPASACIIFVLVLCFIVCKVVTNARKKR